MDFLKIAYAITRQHLGLHEVKMDLQIAYTITHFSQTNFSEVRISINRLCDNSQQPSGSFTSSDSINRLCDNSLKGYISHE